MATGTCARCGTGTSGGTYCRKCHGWAEQLKALLETAGEDAELLAALETLKPADIARAQGVSRQAVHIRIGKARARQAQRAELGVTA